VKDDYGTILLKFDLNNKLLYIQWKDNKVVNLILATGILGISQVKQRIG
jgi:hypothetical protein